jgi:hypothetical protein
VLRKNYHFIFYLKGFKFRTVLTFTLRFAVLHYFVFYYLIIFIFCDVIRYVEVLDKYFGSVCELDIIFNFEKAYFILDELILGGEMQVPDTVQLNSSKTLVSAFRNDSSQCWGSRIRGFFDPWIRDPGWKGPEPDTVPAPYK